MSYNLRSVLFQHHKIRILDFSIDFKPIKVKASLKTSHTIFFCNSVVWAKRQSFEKNRLTKRQIIAWRRLTSEQTNRQTNIQTNKQTDKQTNKQTHRQTIIWKSCIKYFRLASNYLNRKFIWLVKVGFSNIIVSLLNDLYWRKRLVISY